MRYLLSAFGSPGTGVACRCSAPRTAPAAARGSSESTCWRRCGSRAARRLPFCLLKRRWTTEMHRFTVWDGVELWNLLDILRISSFERTPLATLRVPGRSLRRAIQRLPFCCLKRRWATDMHQFMASNWSYTVHLVASNAVEHRFVHTFQVSSRGKEARAVQLRQQRASLLRAARAGASSADASHLDRTYAHSFLSACRTRPIVARESLRARPPAWVRT